MRQASRCLQLAPKAVESGNSGHAEIACAKRQAPNAILTVLRLDL